MARGPTGGASNTSHHGHANQAGRTCGHGFRRHREASAHRNVSAVVPLGQAAGAPRLAAHSAIALAIWSAVTPLATRREAT